MKQDEVEVCLFLAPYHPMVFDYLSTSGDYRIVLEVEDYFRSIAQEKDIPLIGSYDPKALNLSEVDFYDGMHPKTEAIHQIFHEEDKLFPD